MDSSFISFLEQYILDAFVSCMFRKDINDHILASVSTCMDCMMGSCVVF